MKLNKTLLSIGTIAAVATPVASVVACGDSEPTTPPVKGTEGGTTPENQGPTNNGPVIPATKPETTHTDTLVNTDTTKLQSGILNYMADGTFKNEELNKIFEQFTTGLDFDHNPMFALTRLSKIGIDSSKTMVKIMIVVKPIHNHGSVVYLVGNLGTGTDGQVYFTYADFDKADEIKDSPTRSTTMRQLNVFNPDAINKGILFAFMPDIDSDELLAKLVKIAKDNGITK